MILTETGERAVEDLQAGDMVWTLARGLQPIRWIAFSRVTRRLLEQEPRLFPIGFAAGALGAGLPKRDLVVSRQHRMLASSKVAERMFGERDVLIVAFRMIDLPGVEIRTDATEVDYFDFLFDNHEILYAEGAPTESLMSGPEAIRTMNRPEQGYCRNVTDEVADIMETAKSAYPIPEGRRQRKFVEPLERNDVPMFDGWDADQLREIKCA